jgi:hypothetical protein
VFQTDDCKTGTVHLRTRGENSLSNKESLVYYRAFFYDIVGGKKMGQIIIDVPTNDTVHYEVESTQEYKQLIQILESDVKPNPRSDTANIEIPKQKLQAKDFSEVLGMWANRKETGEEISMQIRKGNRRQT